MNAQELTLNIAVNLSRISRWAVEKKPQRINQFLNETENFCHQLKVAPKTPRFQETFDSFIKAFSHLKANPTFDDSWAEAMLTWANILTHRAKLA